MLLCADLIRYQGRPHLMGISTLTCLIWVEGAFNIQQINAIEVSLRHANLMSGECLPHIHKSDTTAIELRSCIDRGRDVPIELANEGLQKVLICSGYESTI